MVSGFNLFCFRLLLFKVTIQISLQPFLTDFHKMQLGGLECDEQTSRGMIVTVNSVHGGVDDGLEKVLCLS